MWHTPNGGSRNKIEAAKFKRLGVLAGVPDIFIPSPKKGKNGLFIEIKTEKGKLSKSQKDIITRLNGIGYEAVVCYGLDEAINKTKDYFSHP